MSLQGRLWIARAVAAAVASWLVAGSAWAEDADDATAEALFQEGKTLLATKDYARACARLGDSFRLDPATGTLLALALCHERAGKLATAWREYAEVVSRSEREGHSDREDVAREKVKRLGAATSKLAMIPSEADAKAPGISLRCDGAPVGPARWGMALPVDGGSHLVEVSADGKVPWRVQVSVAESGDYHVVQVPRLENLASSERTAAPPREPQRKVEPAAPSKTEPPPAAARAESESSPPKAEPAPAPPNEPETRALAPATSPERKRWGSWQYVGASSIVVGAVALGAGAWFTARAIQKNDDSKSGCVGDACSSAAMQERLDARASGDAATVALAAGGALVCGGLLAYVLGERPSRSDAASSGQLRVGAMPVVSSGGWAGVVRGRF